MASRATGGMASAPSLGCAQQTNSGGVRLAREFDAKTSLGAVESGPVGGASQVPRLPGKQVQGSTVELKVNTTWQEAWHPHDGTTSPLINASYPSSQGASCPPSQAGSPEKLPYPHHRHQGSLGSGSRQSSEEPPLKRQYSDTDSGCSGGRGGSKSRRSSLTASPTKDRKGRDWTITTADGGLSVEPDGLHFLLKTCELLDPGMSLRSPEVAAVKEETQQSPRRGGGIPPRAPRSRRAQQQQQQPSSQPASPAKASRRQAAAAAPETHPLQQTKHAVVERSYFRPEESEDDYMRDEDDFEVHDSGAGSDDDYDYVPARRTTGRGTTTRSSRAAARAAAAASGGPAAAQQQAAVPAPLRGGSAPPPGGGIPAAAAAAAAAVVADAAAGAVSGSSDDDEQDLPVPPAAPAVLPPATMAGLAVPAMDRSRGSMVSGPCMNPDCEHPYDSPQWRKGPPNAPVLCNACGTRWLRNGTLKPLVPRRGIRYKNKPRTVSAPPTGKAALKAAAAQRTQQQQAELGAAEAVPLRGGAAPAAELPSGRDVNDEQYQQYLQLAAALGAQQGAAGSADPDPTAAGTPQLALFNPALLAALLGSRVGVGASAGWELPQQAQHQQPAKAEPKQTQAKKSASLVQGSQPSGPPVFQLQALAGGHIVGPVFLAAAPPPLFQKQ